VVLWLGRAALIALWCCAMILVPSVGFPDWVHLFWSAQVPLVGLFMGSGLFLAHATSPQPRGRWCRPWLFFTMTWLLGTLPLLLVTWFPSEHWTWRGVRTPVQGLWELIEWGFGGPLPAALEPQTHVALQRGVDFLPRVITAPMGTTLIAAWLCIAFGLISIISRLVRDSLLRQRFRFLTAPALTFAGFVLAPLQLGIGPLDFGFFTPLGARRTGIWTSDPVVMQSYGPVLLAALLMTALICCWEWRESRRRE